MRVATALGVDQPTRLLARSMSSTSPSTTRTPRQARRERHRDPPRFQHAGGDLGQQRQVQEVVGGVDQHDLGGRRPAASPGMRAAWKPANPPPTTTTRGRSVMCVLLVASVTVFPRGGPGSGSLQRVCPGTWPTREADGQGQRHPEHDPAVGEEGPGDVVEGARLRGRQLRRGRAGAPHGVLRAEAHAREGRRPLGTQGGVRARRTSRRPRATATRDKPTAGGVDANASKKHLQDVARRLDVKGRSTMDKDGAGGRDPEGERPGDGEGARLTGAAADPRESARSPARVGTFVGASPRHRPQRGGSPCAPLPTLCSRHRRAPAPTGSARPGPAAHTRSARPVAHARAHAGPAAHAAGSAAAGAGTRPGSARPAAAGSRTGTRSAAEGRHHASLTRRTLSTGLDRATTTQRSYSVHTE